MQLGSRGAVIPLPVACQEQSHDGGSWKFDFYGWKGHRLAYYLFNFYAKFGANFEKFLYKFELVK